MDVVRAPRRGKYRAPPAASVRPTRQRQENADDQPRSIRTMRDSTEGGDRAELVVGWHPVREALLARARPIGRILLAAERHDGRASELLRLAGERGVPVHRLPSDAFHRLVPRGLPHQGVAAEIAPKAYEDEGSLLARAGPESVFLVLDEVQDPRNLGAIVRTAAAVSASGLFIPARRAAQLTPAAVRASAGGIESVGVARVTNIVRLLERMGEAGIVRVGLDVTANELYTAVPSEGAIALVVGGEERGLRPTVRGACDLLVRIPIRGPIDSLNVSVAAGIALYELLRARSIGSAGHATSPRRRGDREFAEHVPGPSEE